MPIETQFGFQHFAPDARDLTAATPDLLGLLRSFVGSMPAAKPKRQWQGHGWNLLWRPHKPAGPDPDHFLQLMFTNETLSFIDISGSGIANRGFKQGDIKLGGAAYTQEIKDKFDNSDQHFEPGVWVHVPATTNPSEPESVARMGSIPHGTTINLQGEAKPADAARMNSLIPVSSIVPFAIGSVDDGQTGLVHFDEEKLTFVGASRTPLNRVAGLTQEQLTNPNIFLLEANAGLTFQSVTEIKIASSPKLAAGPDVGGGVDNIAFLQGKTAPDANADTPTVTVTYWLQQATDRAGKKITQLQYTQRVLLNFATLSWPHVTVGTLRPV